MFRIYPGYEIRSCIPHRGIRGLLYTPHRYNAIPFFRLISSMIMRCDHALCSCRGPAGIMKETKGQVCGDGGRKTEEERQGTLLCLLKKRDREASPSGSVPPLMSHCYLSLCMVLKPVFENGLKVKADKGVPCTDVLKEGFIF